MKTVKTIKRISVVVSLLLVFAEYGKAQVTKFEIDSCFFCTPSTGMVPVDGTIQATDTIQSEYKENNAGSTKTNKTNADIAISPNPATTTLYVNRTTQELADYAIYSLTGEIVLQGELSGNSSTLNIESLPKGIYYLRDCGKTMRFVKR